MRPDDVILGRQRVEGLSVRNVLAGRLARLQEVGDRLVASVDLAGQILHAELTP